ncbi:ester cyclase [Candidatus Amarobacter glycogenicus]|uniref:ester cyclase n=1 Tax=Candidatus Amarobacter glycogenicus TaxID=3140699 RepID=UPI0031CC6099
MSIEETRAVFEAFKAASNERWLDPEATVSLYSEEGKRTAFGGRDMLEVETAYRVAFPDWQREFNRVVIGEDGFACVSRIRATHTGPFLGGPATNRAIDLEPSSFFRVKDDLIAESVVVNQEAVGAKMFEQLGLPNPADPGPPARAMLQRIFEDSNKSPKDMGFILELYAPAFVRNGVEMTAERWRQLAEAVYRAWPDATQDLTDVTVEGDRIFCRYVMRGTHTGDLRLADRAISASGRQFEVWGMEMRRVRDGKFVELWSNDTLSQLLPQLEGDKASAT